MLNKFLATICVFISAPLLASSPLPVPSVTNSSLIFIASPSSIPTTPFPVVTSATPNISMPTNTMSTTPLPAVTATVTQTPTPSVGSISPGPTPIITQTPFPTQTPTPTQSPGYFPVLIPGGGGGPGAGGGGGSAGDPQLQVAALCPYTKPIACNNDLITPWEGASSCTCPSGTSYIEGTNSCYPSVNLTFCKSVIPIMGPAMKCTPYILSYGLPLPNDPLANSINDPVSIGEIIEPEQADYCTWFPAKVCTTDMTPPLGGPSNCSCGQQDLKHIPGTILCVRKSQFSYCSTHLPSMAPRAGTTTKGDSGEVVKTVMNRNVGLSSSFLNSSINQACHYSSPKTCTMDVRPPWGRAGGCSCQLAGHRYIRGTGLCVPVVEFAYCSTHLPLSPPEIKSESGESNTLSGGTGFGNAFDPNGQMYIESWRLRKVITTLTKAPGLIKTECQIWDTKVIVTRTYYAGLKLTTERPFALDGLGVGPALSIPIKDAFTGLISSGPLSEGIKIETTYTAQNPSPKDLSNQQIDLGSELPVSPQRAIARKTINPRAAASTLKAVLDQSCGGQN